MKNLKSKKSKSKSLLLILLSVIALTPFLLLCRYVYPVNDDFSFALQHLNTNALQSVYESYMAWSGRYLATFLSSVNPYVISDNPLWLFRIFSFFVTILFPLSFWLFALICSKGCLTKLQSAGMGSLLFLTFLALLPSVSQAFYWFSSYTAYSIPSLLYLILVALIAANTKICFYIACIFALILPGGNEIISIITVCTLAYLSFTFRKKEYFILLGLSVAATIIVILSPGNAVRMSYQLSQHPYLWTVAVSIGQTFSWIFLWGPLLLVATLIYIPIYGNKISRMPVFDISLKWFIAVFFITVMLAHVPVSLGLSSVLADRTANCLLIFYIIGYFFGINIIIRRHPVLTSKFTTLFSNKWLFAISTFCFLFLGAFSPNGTVTTAVTDLITGKADDYARIQQRRINIVKNDHDNNIIVLPPLGLTSKSLFIKEFETSPDGGFLKSFTKVYGCNAKVYIKEENVIFEDNYTSLKNYGKKIRADE